MKNIIISLVLIVFLAAPVSVRAQMPGVPGPVGPNTESPNAQQTETVRIVNIPSDVPHAVACIDEFGKKSNIDFFYIHTITKTQLHYQRNGDLLVYERSNGAYSTNMNAQQWDCARDELSLRALSAAGRTYTSLTPLIIR